MAESKYGFALQFMYKNCVKDCEFQSSQFKPRFHVVRPRDCKHYPPLENMTPYCPVDSNASEYTTDSTLIVQTET
jgi:hypothetical protein